MFYRKEWMERRILRSEIERRQRQEDLCEDKASLVYTSSSNPDRVI